MQAAAFALAGGLGWEGPWRTAVMAVLERLGEAALCATSLVLEADRETRSFSDYGVIALSTWAAAAKIGLEATNLQERAAALRDGLLSAATSWSGDVRRRLGLLAACLLARSERLVGHVVALDMIRRLYFAAASQKNALGFVILNKPHEGLESCSESARFAVQIAWLRAATALAETVELRFRKFFVSEAEVALQAIQIFLTPEGLWRER